MISLKLINGYKRHYKEETGRDLGVDIYLSAPKTLNMDINYWAKVVCKYFDIRLSDLKGRVTQHIMPRRWFYYICILNKIPQETIAEYTKRDRSTISQNNQVFLRGSHKIPNFKQIEVEIIKYGHKE